MCAPKIEGMDNVKPREISREQWSRMFVAEDMAEYKTSLAAKVFADVLGAKVAQSETQSESVKLEAPTVAPKTEAQAESVKPEARVESVEVEKAEEVEEVVARQGFKR